MQIVCTKISAKLGIEMIFKKLARCKKDIKLEQLPVLFEIIESKSRHAKPVCRLVEGGK